MRRLKALASVVLVLALAACAPESGTVTGKKYYPPYDWTDSVCMANDPKTGFCTLRVPTVHHNPARWLLCLDNGEDQGCRDVDQRSWHEYENGEQYP